MLQDKILWCLTIFALAACSTLVPQRVPEPASQGASETLPAELEPLPEPAAARSLQAELLWRRQQSWMTRSSFLSGVQPFSDGSMLVGGQNTGKLTLGQGRSVATIVGGSGTYGRRVWIARYDMEGELLWAKPTAGNFISSFVVTSDDAIIVTGQIHPHESSGNDPEISRVFGVGTQRQSRVPDCEPVFDVYRRVAPSERWGPTSSSAGLRNEPTCSIWFVARFDGHGNFQWVRTAHSQYGRDAPVPVALPDGSVAVRYGLAGVVLLDAGTPNERNVDLPLRYYEQPVPFLIRYSPDGDLTSVAQLALDDEKWAIRPLAMDDGMLGVIGWRGNYVGTTDRSRYLDFPPVFTISALNDEDNFLWEIQLEVAPETFRGANSFPDEVARFPNGDLLVTIGYRFRGTTGLSHGKEVFHQTTSNPVTEEFESARIQYALRVDRRGNIRWLIPTLQAQRSRGLTGFPGIVVLKDGSWLLHDAPRDGDTDYVVAPGQPGERRMDEDAGPFIARFFPDGRLDSFLESPELEHWIPSTRERLPDGSYYVVREDWRIHKDVPTPVFSRVRLDLVYDEEE